MVFTYYYNIFLLNDEESYQYTGISDVELSAKTLLEAGPEIVIIKMGSRGSLVSSNILKKHIPCHPIDKLVDPTGAGDTFAGGFVGYLALNLDNPNFIEAAVVGSAMASFCVEGFGAKTLLNITNELLDLRIEKIKQLN